MNAAKQNRARKQRGIENPELKWNGPDYPSIPAGVYSVTGKRAQGPEFVRSYRRWSIRIEFAPLDGSGTVSRFFNLGSRDKPTIGRQSLYFKWWVAANGEFPKRGQEMTPDVFFEDQIFEVVVEDACLNSEQLQKGTSEIYSRVTELRTVVRP